MKHDTTLARAKKLQLLHAPKTDVMFHGISMQPLLTEGDRVILEPISFDKIQVGDIITSIYEDKYPTRRVVIKKKDRLRVWCENRPNRSFIIQPEEVLGKIIARNRSGELLSITDKEWQQLTQKALKQYRKRRIKHFFKRLHQLIIKD